MKKIFFTMLAVGLFGFAYAAPMDLNIRKAPRLTRDMIAPVNQTLTAQPKRAAQADPIAITPLTSVEFAWYPSYSTKEAYMYELFVVNEDKAADYLPQFSIYIYAPGYQEVIGTFSVANKNVLVNSKTGAVVGGLYVAANNEAGYEEIALKDVNLTTALVEDGKKVSVKGTLTASDNRVFSVDLTTAKVYLEDAEHPSEPTSAQSLNLIMDPAKTDGIIADYWEEQNPYIYVDFTTTDGNFLELVFYTTTSGLKTIPDGTYSFSFDQDDYHDEIVDNSFLIGAYRYADENSTPYNSYYYVTNEAYYYLSDGTIKLSTDSKGNKVIEVDAISFYGTPFKFSYNFGTGVTPVENVNIDTKATKIVKDGQILILRNGQYYNAIGTIVR